MQNAVLTRNNLKKKIGLVILLALSMSKMKLEIIFPCLPCGTTIILIYFAHIFSFIKTHMFIYFFKYRNSNSFLAMSIILSFIKTHMLFANTRIYLIFLACTSCKEELLIVCKKFGCHLDYPTDSLAEMTIKIYITYFPC
jgi:hypothetical protein